MTIPSTRWHDICGIWLDRHRTIHYLVWGFGRFYAARIASHRIASHLCAVAVASLALFMVSEAKAQTSAGGFSITQVDNRYRYQFHIEELNLAAGPPLTVFDAARGQQVTVAYWLNNDTGKTQTVWIDVNNMTSSDTSDLLDRSAIEARVLTWKDRITTHFRETGDQCDDADNNNDGLTDCDPLWYDVNTNGTMDRSDWETLYPVAGGPGFNDSWLTSWRRDDTDDDSSFSPVDLKLERLPDPLPLYWAEGVVDAPITIPDGESRVLWLSITIPDDQDTGSYGGPGSYWNNTSPVAFYLPLLNVAFWRKHLDLDLEIRVPCWDSVGDTEPNLFNYSYLPGTNDPEQDGIMSDFLTEDRARIRYSADHNTMYILIGEPSRWPATNAISPDMYDIVEGFRDDWLEYQIAAAATSDPDPIDTIVLSTVAPERIVPDWGPTTAGPWDPASPAWVANYQQLFTDFETVLAGLPGAWKPNLANYEIVVVPIDEPQSVIANGVADASAWTQATIDTIYPNSTFLRTLTSNSSTGWAVDFENTPRCWMQHTIPVQRDPGNTSDTVLTTRRTFFRSAADAIRGLPSTSEFSDAKILMNHDVPERTMRDELLGNFENCGTSSDCVDIWMQAGVMDDSMPEEHALNDGLFPEASGDQFWWYQFGSTLGPMRYLQFGLVLDDYGFSGFANWTFWAAGKTPQSLLVGPDPLSPGTPYDYTPHSWLQTVPAIWGQETSIFLPDHVTHPAWPNGDPTAHNAPNGETLIPGRVIFARRQALEIDRLMRELGEVQHPSNPLGVRVLNAQAQSLLATLISEATDQCHDAEPVALLSSTCTNNQATPDEVIMVLHAWLDRGWEHLQTCPSHVPVPYTSNSGLVNTALGMHPW